LHARRESNHGFTRVFLGEPYEKIRVGGTKVTFQPTIAPRQTQYRDRTRTRRVIGMTVEFAVEKYISRLHIHAAPEAGLDKGTGKYHACIAVRMQMTRRCLATRKHFNSEASSFAFELSPHGLKSI
jgi:hypothetical protein